MRLDRHSLVLVNRPLGHQTMNSAPWGRRGCVTRNPAATLTVIKSRPLSPTFNGAWGSVSLRMAIGIGNLSRAGHLLGAHQAVELLRRDEAEPPRLFLQRGAVGMRRLRHLGRVVVADLGSERRHQHQRTLHQFPDALLVGADAADAMLSKGARG